MKKIAKYASILLLIFTCFIPSTLQAEITDVLQSWVVHFNSPGYLEDRATDLEVDPAKNVYVTGISGSDVVVLKYDSNRNLLWQRILGVEVFPWTKSFLELDGADNVYIAYTEVDEGTFPCDENECINIVTRKYDPSGIMQWEKKFGPDLDGSVSDLEVDNAGNVYVARKWNGLIKYDTNGTEQWWSWMSSEISDIEFDIGDDILTTGRYSSGAGETSLHTAKRSAEGDLIAYDNNESDIDGGLAVTVDSEGSIYVAGISILGSDNVIKYKRDFDCPTTLEYCYLDSDWTTRFGTTATWEQPNSIALDMDGNVYVSGSSRLTDTSLYDCLTAKYDPSGYKLWEARYDADSKEDLQVAMVTDDNANVYVACQSVEGDPLQRDYVTIMYDAVGNQLWVKRYDGPVHGADYVSDIELDDDGDVYVTGSISTSHGSDIATVKYTKATTANAIASLLFKVEDMDLQHGIENSLVSKINNISRMYDRGKENTAVNVVQAFINQIEKIQGIKLTDEQASELITRAQVIIHTME